MVVISFSNTRDSLVSITMGGLSGTRNFCWVYDTRVKKALLAVSVYEITGGKHEK